MTQLWEWNLGPGSPRPNKEWSLGWSIERIPYYQWAKFGLGTPRVGWKHINTLHWKNPIQSSRPCCTSRTSLSAMFLFNLVLLHCFRVWVVQLTIDNILLHVLMSLWSLPLPSLTDSAYGSAIDPPTMPRSNSSDKIPAWPKKPRWNKEEQEWCWSKQKAWPKGLKSQNKSIAQHLHHHHALRPQHRTVEQRWPQLW